jgi:hypothetical protein
MWLLLKNVLYHVSACLQAFRREEETEMSKELERRKTLGDLADEKGCKDDEHHERQYVPTGTGDRLHGEIIHDVCSSDTLAGLSLRYGVSVQRIKQVGVASEMV